MQKRIRKAVIPAAGYGTRFLPVTKAIPKEMIPIVDKPVIQYIVEEALQSGIEEILIITGHGKRAIEDHFDTNIDLELQLRQQGKDQLLHLVQDISSINIHYIRQKHMRGLGDAIRCAESFIDNEPFAVLLGDDVVYNPEQPALKQMMDAFSRLGATMLGCQEVLRHRPGPADGRRPRRQAHRHGRKAGCRRSAEPPGRAGPLYPDAGYL
jgi:UTP--glucose-1-phosphate uridylyltransferase